uniref:Uncharacterized protein n=1 Tax=viral metagenome TaxID=1070528 RepID=A0A6M3KS82_9ZZZZ
MARALFLIPNQSETEPAVIWLKDEIKRLENDNRWEPDEVVFRQRQGALQVLDALLTETEKADKNYRDLKNNE